jgi:hypothetical protein
MKKVIISGIIMLVTGSIATAQFVGDGASSPKPATAPNGLTGTFKFGAALPIAEFKTTPSRTANPQYASGVMGAKTGLFFEAGMGMSLTNPDKPVGFYYYPVLASYWRTSLDWSELGGFFSDQTIYTKPVNILDIAQRYGIVVKPVKDFSIALYYRPGLIIPFKYEVVHESVPNGESFLFTGELGSGDEVPIFMMSHTAGLEIRYNIAYLSIERYSAKPTFDVQYKDLDVNPLMVVNQTSQVKIPVKLMVLSLGVNF